jgi:hypothetical protein
LVKELAVIRENSTNPSSPLLFDIKKHGEAVKIDVEERKQAGPARPEQAAPIALSRGDAPDITELPIDDYESLSGRRISRRLSTGEFSQEDLMKLLAFERAHSNRRTVVKEFEKYLRVEVQASEDTEE